MISVGQSLNSATGFAPDYLKSVVDKLEEKEIKVLDT